MQIKIGESVIPATPGTSLPLVLRSPIFIPEDGKIPGSYIFNTSFPPSDVLRTEFNLAQRIQRHGRATAELPYLITAGSLRFQGNCIVTLADAEQFEIAFKVNNGELAGKLLGKTLKNLDLGGEQVIVDLLSIAGIETEILCKRNFNQFFADVIDVPNKIVKDLTNSLSLNGKSFTAPFTGNCNLKIIVNTFIYLGSVLVTVRKNSTAIYSESFTSGNISGTMEINLSLIAGEAITIEAKAVSIPEYNVYKTFLGIKAFTVEFSGINIFTQTITDQLTQDETDFAVFPITNTLLTDNFPDDAFMLDNLSLKTLYSLYFPVQNYFHNGQFPLILNTEIEGEFFLLQTCLLPLFTLIPYSTKLSPKPVIHALITLFSHMLTRAWYCLTPLLKIPFLGIMLPLCR